MSFFKSTEDKRDEHTNIEVMVDIETMGTTASSPVLTIGAVLFDPLRQDTYDYLLERSFLRQIKISESIKNSSGVDGDTLTWWLQQDDVAIKGLVSENAIGIAEAFEDFSQYCRSRNATTERFFPGHSEIPQACRVWAKGPDFDCKILEESYSRLNMFFPFKFWEYRCVRTVTDLGFPNGDPPVIEGIAHDARHDAIGQAMVVQFAYEALGLAPNSVRFHK